ncbi:MAG: TonB-dependent receptor plug domain-containing protein [Paludibacteraceae bacterium]
MAICQHKNIKQRKLHLLFPLFLFFQIAWAQNAPSTNDSLQHIEIKEISILGKVSNNILSGSTGIDIDLKKAIQLPKLIGENDIYKALQHLGGVTLSGEANGNLYVRGGNYDQNLVLLNGAIVHNPTHALGLFSIFNSDITSQLRFFKYGVPAEYGGKLSSVIDVSTLSAVRGKVTVKGTIGLIMSKLMTHTPLNKNLSIYGSWRGSYISKTAFPVLHLAGIDSSLTRNRYEFWDINAGFIYKISPKSMLYGTIYKGDDELKITDYKQFSFNGNSSEWSNLVSSLQLNHLFSESFSMSHKLCFSRFDLFSSFDWFNSVQHIKSKLKNITYKTDFLYLYRNNIIKFGAEASFNNTKPNIIDTDTITLFNVSKKSNVFHSSLVSLYLRDEFTWRKWLINGGIRMNYYTHLGTYTDFLSEDTVHYTANKPVKNYFSVEPRLFVRYLIDNARSVKLSTSRYHQFLNQLPIFSIGLPTDIQIPASLHVKPQSSWHLAAGYFQNFNESQWESSMEVYYKTMENQLNFKSEIISLFSTGEIERYLLNGKGWAYGAEWKIQKNTGKFTGWINYNLCWSYRQFDGINKGKPYVDTNNRRHDISIVGMYQLNERWSFSGLFAFASGSRLNLPLSWYIIDGKTVFEYGTYNSFTLPVYHRLDLSASYKMRPFRGIKSELNFSVYNVYNRANPFMVYFSRDTQALKMNYLLPVLPSISWNFAI